MLNLLSRILYEIGKWVEGEDSMEASEQEFWERMQRKYGDVLDEDLEETRGNVDNWDER